MSLCRRIYLCGCYTVRVAPVTNVVNKVGDRQLDFSKGGA